MLQFLNTPEESSFFCPYWGKVALMGKKGSAAKDRVVCYCYSVTEAVIVEAIARGCRTLMDIRRETYASSGCAGCTEEVKKLLRKHAGRHVKATPADSGAGPVNQE